MQESPQNTAFLALHRLGSRIIFLCFKGSFYIGGWVNFCSEVLSINSIGGLLFLKDSRFMPSGKSRKISVV